MKKQRFLAFVLAASMIFTSLSVNTMAEEVADAPTEEAIVEDAPAEVSQADEAQADDAQVDEAQVDETQVDEAQVDETQVDEAQVDETQVDEAQVDEAQADEAQVDETQADETQNNDTQADDAQNNEIQADNSQADNSSSDSSSSSDDVNLLSIVPSTSEYAAYDWVTGNTFGPTHSKPYEITGDEAAGTASVKLTEGGTGKHSSNEDSIGYYLMAVPVSDSFNMSGKVAIDALNTLDESHPGQTSLGMVLLNNLFSKKDANDDDTGTATTYSIFNNLFISSDNSSSGNFAATTRLNASELGKKNVQKTFSATVNAAGSNLGTFDLAISKSGSNYKVICGDESFSVADSEGVITGDEKGFIYVGFFAARNAAISVSDIKYEKVTKIATSLTIKTPPTKTEYYYGEDLDTTGLEVEVGYHDLETGADTTETAPLDSLSITGYDSKMLGEQPVSVASGDFSDTFTVNVRPMKVTEITLKSTPVINQYNKGGYFSTAGISASATYEDGTTANLQSNELIFTIDGQEYIDSAVLNSSLVGAKTVYVSRVAEETIDPNDVSATYDITINDVELERIYVAVEPAKKTYYVGDEFEPDGLVIRGAYSNNSFANINENDYTIQGFDSTKVSDGELTLTVVYNLNPSFTTQFNVKVINDSPLRLVVENYPKTTYNVGDSFDPEGIKVVTFYRSGLKTDAVLGTDYTIDTAEYDINKNIIGETKVTIVPTNTNFESIEIPVTIREKQSDFKWRGSVFGQSSGSVGNDEADSEIKGGNTEVIPDNMGTAEGKIFVRSWNGAGKITNAGHDGIGYYYTTVPSEDNFTLSADVHVIGYIGSKQGPFSQSQARNGQEGFGLMARDVVPLKGLDGSMTTDTTKAVTDEYGPVPMMRGTTWTSNMVLAGAYSYSKWPEDPTAASYERNKNRDRINIFARTGLIDSDGGGTITNSELYPISSTFPKAELCTAVDDTTHNNYQLTKDSWESEVADAGPLAGDGDNYRITLKRVNVERKADGTLRRGIQATCTNLKTGETMTDFMDDVAMNNIFEVQNDEVYVGFFAARWAVAEFSNVELYTSNPETDEIINTVRTEEITPSMSVSSRLYSSTSDYNLVVKTNNDNGGYITISQNGNIIIKDIRITSKTTSFPTKLVENSTNVFKLIYTPSTADKLTSYAPIVRTVNIVHNNIREDTGILYVSPTGSGSGTGSRDNPLDIDSAVGFAVNGEKIVMMDGIYSYPKEFTISEDRSGIKSNPRYLWADDGAFPVIDFENVGSGANIGASNWHIKGIGFTRAADHALQIGGKYNTIENCVAFNNLGTGIQIARTNSAETIDEWPSYNLILNCEAYNNADRALDGADGFAAKLTVGYGNVFKGCISHHNSDDGWDCYAKLSSGPIGPVVLEDCVSYRNGYRLNDDGSETPYGKGGHNGYKMGGENIPVKHYLKDCITFQNDPDVGSGSGLSCNSNPNMKVRNLIAWNNTFKGINLYSSYPERYSWDLKGIVSIKNGNTDIIGSYLNKDTNYPNNCELDLTKENSNYLEREAGKGSTNNLGEAVDESIFVSTDVNAVLGSDQRFDRNADGSFNVGDFLKRKQPYIHEESDLVKLPGVGGISFNGYGDPNSVTIETSSEESSESTSEDISQSTTNDNNNSSSGGSHSSGSSGGSSSKKASGGSSSSSSSSNNESSKNETANKEDSKNETANNEAADNETANNETENNNDSNAPTVTAENNDKSFTTSTGLKITVPSVKPNVNTNFSDKNTRAWASNAIDKLAAAGIINGVGNNQFAPDANSKRGDLVVMLVRTLGLEGTPSKNFSDVDSSKYYANAVGLALEAGIATGSGDNTFNPEGTISRQDMMVLTAKTLQLIGVETNNDESVLDKFADSANIAPYARPFVAILVNAGIVNGTGSNIDATSDITRAQMAVMMSSIYDLVSSTADKAN